MLQVDDDVVISWRDIYNRCDYDLHIRIYMDLSTHVRHSAAPSHTIGTQVWTGSEFFKL